MNPSSAAFDCEFRDGEAEAGPAVRRGERVPADEESVEELVVIFRGDARSGVLDADLRRSRVICTSITLSIGVKREFSCHTYRASISRDTVRFRCSARKSSRSNSRVVRSSGVPHRWATRIFVSKLRSATSTNCDVTAT